MKKFSSSQIKKIEWDNGHITIYFKNSSEPWEDTEFSAGSKTRNFIEDLQEAIRICITKHVS